APTLAKLAAVVEGGENLQTVAAETAADLEHEAILDPAIVPRTEGKARDLDNAFLTGATGFLGAFLLSELLVETHARIHCLVRATDMQTGYRKIMEHLKSFGLWDPVYSDRVVPVPGDLASPSLGLTPKHFEALAGIIDVIYHSGATVNFYYPYSVLKAANVLSTEELLRMASVGRNKSLHFVSTLHVTSTRARKGSRPIITEKDPLPEA